MAEDLNNNIVSLDDLDDFEVSPEDPDVRGWKVVGSDGVEIGEVDQLLVDTSAMKVRYLDVDVDDDLIEVGDEDRHVLVPIGFARLDEDEENVIVDRLSKTDVAGLPAYSHEPITRDYEVTVRRRFEPGHTDIGRDEFYEHQMYDPDRFWGR